MPQLSAHHGDCCPGGAVYVRTTHLDDRHREITARGYRFMRPGIEHTPWRSRLMEVIDPFGDPLRFDEERRQSRAMAERVHVADGRPPIRRTSHRRGRAVLRDEQCW